MIFAQLEHGTQHVILYLEGLKRQPAINSRHVGLVERVTRIKNTFQKKRLKKIVSYWMCISILEHNHCQESKQEFSNEKVS